MSKNDTERIEMTDEGLALPAELAGSTGRIAVEWPSEKMQKQIMTIVEPGLPEVCGYICRGVMPSDTTANGVPGGHLRINGKLYQIEDARTLNTDTDHPEDGEDA